MKRDLIIKVLTLLVITSLLIFLFRGSEYMLLISAAILIHETGHIVTAKAEGVRFTRGNGIFGGFSLKFDFSSVSYLKEVTVAVAGAAFNVIACILTLLLNKSPGVHSVFFIFSNLSLAIFNLIPVSPLDGAGILRALLSMISGPYTAEIIAAGVSAVFSFAFFILCTYIQLKVGINLSLMFVSLVLLYNTLKSTKLIQKQKNRES